MGRGLHLPRGKNSLIFFAEKPRYFNLIRTHPSVFQIYNRNTFNDQSKTAVFIVAIYFIQYSAIIRIPVKIFKKKVKIRSIVIHLVLCYVCEIPQVFLQ
jgi:hypothetical protein